MPNSDVPLFVEIFAGRGSLSRAFSQAGFSVLSIDHDGSKALVPMITLDLTTSSGQAILWDILQSRNLLGIHLGLPCGTASLARERPVPEALRAQGAPNPPPLRSAMFPLGLPDLSEYHRAKVDSANTLYKLAIDIILFCRRQQIIVSVENPANSWLWAALVRLSLEHSAEAAEAYNALEKVVFHACCHGSTRRKATGWLGTAGVYTALEATCQNDHVHQQWGIHWAAGAWVFDTSAEAAYPALLSQRAAQCMLEVVKQRQLTLQAPPRLHDLATAAQGKQSKRHAQLIPEFHHFKKQSVSETQQPGTKLLAPHLGGDSREELQTGEIGPQLEPEGGQKFVKVGVYHTPKQFLSLAQELKHPIDATDHLEPVTRQALCFNLRYPAEVVKLERKKNLLFAKLLVAQTEPQEKALHEGLPPSLARVLSGKRLLVWEQLLRKYEYDDMEVVRFMREGVRLVGAHDTPPCYPEKIKAASLTKQDLEDSAVWRRKAIIGKRVEASDPAHLQHLEETALEETDMGFIEGPFWSEKEVSDYFGHDRWMVVRRFVLVQGAEQKLRPIDDCLEAQLNMGFTSTSYLKLQDVDYIASLALRVAEAVSSGQQRHGSGEWQGKCLDLSKAYKQMGIHPCDRHLAVVYFAGVDGRPRFYVSNSLMFGSTAAVYSFNRVSRSIWWLFNKMLMIPCGVFYDDYPLFSPAELAEDSDCSASALLDILGWKHARTGPKGLPFSQRFQVLGCTLDLSRVPRGDIVTENKLGRLDRIREQLTRIRQVGKISLHEAQILHGLLRYSCGFFSGRHLFQVCAEIVNFMSASATSRRANVSDFCDYAADMLERSKPRTISSKGERRPVLVFTDGAWESDTSGLGAVLVDCATGEKHVLAGEVPKGLLDHWKQQVGEQLICQIELYAMVAVRWQFRELLAQRRVIWFVDNEAARFSAIKGISATTTMRVLVREFFSFEAESPSFPWIERVPSASNPADGPSRKAPEEVMALLGVNTCGVFEHPEELVTRLSQSSRSLKKG